MVKMVEDMKGVCPWISRGVIKKLYQSHQREQQSSFMRKITSKMPPWGKNLNLSCLLMNTKVLSNYM